MTFRRRVAKALANRRPVALLLFAALCLHNAEEAVTFSLYRDSAQHLIRSLGWWQFGSPTTAHFRSALIGVTVLSGLLLAFAAAGPGSRWKAWCLPGVAAVLLINVFVPHLPAAVLLGGYAPGVVTAVVVNLPLTVLILFASVKERVGLR